MNTQKESTSTDKTDLIGDNIDSTTPKPNTIRDLSQIFQSYLNRNRHPPAGIDSNPVTAAKQWVNLQEPPGYNEQAQRVSMRKGGFTWNTPYLDRLKLNLRKFLSFNETDQRIIVDAFHAKNLIWRGEDVSFFKLIIEQRAKT